MIARNIAFILPFLLVYFVAFQSQERLFREYRSDLEAIPSHHIIKAATGYLRQITAEMVFVKASVFLGGLPQTSESENPPTYAPILSHNLRQITLLYPEFTDPYYYANAYLPPLGKVFAESANDILTTGISANPTDFVLRLFQGINQLNYLDDPLAAGETFQKASLLPNSPSMFGHIAAILTAQGGGLQVALISLELLRKNEENPFVRERYEKEIAMFHQAIELQNAVTRYYQATGAYPDQLTTLVPNYIKQIPTFDNLFELVWDPPQVKLKRPSPKQSSPIPWQ